VNGILRRLALLLVLVLVLVLAVPGTVFASEWQADPADKQQRAVQRTIEAFLAQRPELTEYFEQAWGYAVFPRVLKGASMFGGAWGKGLVIEDDRLVGRCSQLLISLGAQLGAQSYSQVILFRDAAAMETFKRGRLEFEGRASVVALTAGAAIDPAYLPDVAIFSLIEGGLMFEAAAGGVKYSYRPLRRD
jgi:lipid-binding SYLF domain-containing protein